MSNTVTLELKVHNRCKFVHVNDGSVDHYEFALVQPGQSVGIPVKLSPENAELGERLTLGASCFVTLSADDPRLAQATTPEETEPEAQDGSASEGGPKVYHPELLDAMRQWFGSAQAAAARATTFGDAADADTQEGPRLYLVTGDRPTDAEIAAATADIRERIQAAITRHPAYAVIPGEAGQTETGEVCDDSDTEAEGYCDQQAATIEQIEKVQRIADYIDLGFFDLHPKVTAALLRYAGDGELADEIYSAACGI